MNISNELLPGGVTRINLSGRMDIEGVAQIETKLAEMAGPPQMSVIVDMSEVPYMASIGIRALLINAKSVMRRGGKFALFSPQPNVMSVLITSGIDKLMSVCGDHEAALLAVK